MDDVRWLGADWEDRIFFASDYFDQLYQWAVQLIKDGKAFVCDLTGDEIREHRGTLTEPGKPSPYRDRSVEENLELFERMKNGDFKDGQKTLRAKVDMASPQHQPARPGDVPHPARASPSHGATSGASTRCTIGRTGKATRLRRSPTASARWSSRTTARCTTGTSRRSASTPRSKLSSPA